MISVALCTYNGSRYIHEQVASILNQTCPVDEIVVCDDGSTDDTIDIIKSIKKNNRTEVKIYVNEQNLHPTENFEKAISLCNGDYIFLSDQDDEQNNSEVWKKFPYGDMVVVLHNLCSGVGYYIDDYMSCYRTDPGGYNSKVSSDASCPIKLAKQLIIATKAFEQFTD